jgi:glyoxylase I family protein
MSSTGSSTDTVGARGTSAPTAAPPTLAGYHHIGLTVSDVAASEVWYRRVFGMERLMVEAHGEGAGYAVVLGVPGTPLCLGLDHHHDNPGQPFEERRTGLDHVSFAVGTREELDRWRGHLDQLAVPHSGIAGGTEPFDYALIVFRDPDNIQLEVTWS